MNGKIEKVQEIETSLNILEKINITKEESETYEIKDNQGITSWKEEFEKEFSFSNGEKSVLKKSIENYNKFTLDRRFFELFEKFDVKMPEEKEED